MEKSSNSTFVGLGLGAPSRRLLTYPSCRPEEMSSALCSWTQNEASGLRRLENTLGAAGVLTLRERGGAIAGFLELCHFSELDEFCHALFSKGIFTLQEK